MLRPRLLRSAVTTVLLCAALLLAAGPAHAAPAPSGNYTGTTVQTHYNDQPDPDRTVRPISFNVDSQGRIGSLSAEYFWYCGQLGNTVPVDAEMPRTAIQAGTPFEIVWGHEVIEFTLTGTINADGTGSGKLYADIVGTAGVCGASILEWTASTPGAPNPNPGPTDPPGFIRTAPYTLPGEHTVNGRQWRTVCTPYSQTERCHTEIWATQITRTGNTFTHTTDWAFNNLTYLPFMTRAQWASNPLGKAGQFTGADGRQWRTECDTAATGNNGCRSYAQATVYSATPRPGGGYTYAQKTDWVFNNIVQFR